VCGYDDADVALTENWDVESVGFPRELDGCDSVKFKLLKASLQFIFGRLGIAQN
jgi:hypothetical protein